MCNPLVIDKDDVIKLNNEFEQWKVLDYGYNNEDPILATQIILDVEQTDPQMSPKQIDVDMHIVLDDHPNHYDVNSYEKRPEINQIILYVTFAHTVEFQV